MKRFTKGGGWRRRFAAAARVSVLLGILAVLFPSAAPVILNALVLPGLLRRTDSPIRIEVRRLGYTGLDAAIALGTGDHPGMEIGHVRGDYSLTGLLHRTITRVTLNGAVLRLERADTGWRLRGWPTHPTPSRRGIPALPSWRIQDIVCRRAELYVDTPAGTRRFTGDLQANGLHLGPSGAGVVIRLTTPVHGVPLEMGFSLNLQGDRLELHGDPALAASLPSLAELMPRMPVDGHIRKLAVHGLARGADRLEGSAEAEIELFRRSVDAPPPPTAAVMRVKLTLSGSRERLSGTLTADVDDSTAWGPSVRMGPIHLAVPWDWPLSEEGSKARLTVAHASAGTLTAGPMELDARIHRDGLAFSGSCPLGLTPAATVRMEGSANWQPGARGGTLRLNLPLDANVTPRPLDTAMPRIELTGTLGAQFDMGPNQPARIKVQADLDQVTLPDHALRLSGVRTQSRFNLAEWPASPPGQVLTIDRIALGSLVWDHLAATYRTEADRRLSLQEAQAAWCGGTIDLKGLTIQPGADDLSILLHADRLRISDLFQQLGLPDAFGDGTLSGRLPIFWQHRQVRFENGFLSTTPGRDGVISFGEKANGMAGAIAQGTASDAQLAMAGAALKAFAYDWMTLSLNSENDALQAQLSLSGRPAEPIPFKYVNKAGTYIVQSAKRGHGFRPPMAIDLNFRIPLDEVMRIAVHVQERMDNHAP